MILKNVCVVKFNNPNMNGRVYSPDCFNLDDPVLKERLACGMLLGELGFPEEQRDEVDITKVSHRVLKFYKRKDGLYADIETLDTPNGRRLAQVATKYNFRTRGNGTLIPRDDGYYDVDANDYEFITVDYTDDPA